MRVITHRRRAAALAAERVYYASHIEVLEPDHRERRFVAALCLYSHAVDTSQAGCAHYDQETAERVYYASHIEVLEPDHPERRFVAALCLYSHAVDTSQAGCAHYDQGPPSASPGRCSCRRIRSTRSGIDQTSTWPSDSPRRSTK
jgi:hypothetical protein